MIREVCLEACLLVGISVSQTDRHTRQVLFWRGNGCGGFRGGDVVGVPAALWPGGSTGLRVRQTQNQVMHYYFLGCL